LRKYAKDCYRYQDKCDRLSESEQAQERAIILPLFHQMSEQEQERAIALLKSISQV
jgi:dTDP-4-amino-4,6-dideoxygalactose transaminase